MGLFQKLFGRKKNTETKETMRVEVDGDHADVAPVATETKAPVAKTTTKANNTARATTKKTATKTTTAKTNTSNAKTTTATKQCAATTKAGTQCKRAPVGRSKFCATHKN